MSASLELRMQPWRAGSPAAPVHRSHWLDEALALEPSQGGAPLAGEQRADVCVVGGGFTGLWTALRLLEQAPSLQVVIVEADVCGSGASGRNSGGTGHWWTKLPLLLRLLGRDDACNVLAHSVQAVQDIHDFAARHGIDAGLRREPSAWTTTMRGQPEPWAPMFKAAQSVGLQPPHRVLGADELRALFGAAPAYSGIIEDTSTRMQPARFARQLRRLALARGVRVHEHSPVTRIAGGAQGVRVETPTGAVLAAQVVLAANAWMAHLPAFRPYIAVVSSDIVMTGPIPQLLEQHGLTRRPAGLNARQMVNYGGLTREGRVYVGRGGGSIAYGNRITAAFDYSARRAAEVEGDLRYLYPELAEVPIERSWAGPIDRTPSGLPWFGCLAEDARVHYGIGYSGHGVAASALGGRILTAQLLQREDEWRELGRCLQRARGGYYPIEPLRSIAAHTIRAAVARKEQTEQEGRGASRLDRLLAGYANASLPRPPGRI